jgi:putative glutathione S-transferase
VTRTTPVVPARFASPIDAFAFGEHRGTAPPARTTGARRFAGRITADGSSGHPAEPGRYHVYGGWFCPRSHRAAIVMALAGLTRTVSMSYVDGLRDGRGWAFRERTGPDAVNGFALLREAYEATEVGFDGPVSIPVLWDRREGRIVSNDPDTIDVDLATAFARSTPAGTDLYPEMARGRIDDLNRRTQLLERSIVRAVYSDGAKPELGAALRDLDRRLTHSRFLLGDTLSLADVRLWVVLARYDVGPNANGGAGPKLTSYPGLWAYARELYSLPAFRETTDFDAFRAPLTPVPDWSRPAGVRAGRERTPR